MPRCNKCLACTEVLKCRRENLGKRGTKKVKRVETANPCQDAVKSTKKRRITEAENLRSAGHGGQIRGEITPSPSLSEIHMDRAERAARPTDLTDAPFTGDAAREKYMEVVVKCTKLVKSSRSLDVRAEATSMIPKMNILLDPKAWSEVDYTEAAKDCSKIFMKWLHNEAAGTRAFIPDLNDRDECYAALQIYSCALEESKLIPIEYQDSFGEEGIWVYNTMIENIGEREKCSLPFVNMCLRSWMDRLLEDIDLWPNMNLLQYDKWLNEEMNKTREHGKTSFQLMMSTFGSNSCGTTQINNPSQVSYSTNTTAVAECSNSCTCCPKANRFLPATIPVQSRVLTRTASPSMHLSMPTTATVSSKKSPTNTVPVRTSKLQKVGEELREKLIISSRKRIQYRSTKQANEFLSGLSVDTDEGQHTSMVMDACQRAARRMEDLLFTNGGAERLLLTLKFFHNRPAIREVGALKELLNNDTSTNYYTKEEKLNSAIAKSLKDFLRFFWIKKGRRSNEDQNAYDVVMVALNSDQIMKHKLGRVFARHMQVSRRAIKRGRAMRKSMEDMDKKKWIRRPSVVPKNAIGVGKA